MHFAISKHSSTNWPQICGKKLGLIPVFVEAVDQTRAFCQLTKLEAPIFRSLEYSENNWMKCENYYGTCIYIDLKFDRGGGAAIHFTTPSNSKRSNLEQGGWTKFGNTWTKCEQNYVWRIKCKIPKWEGGLYFASSLDLVHLYFQREGRTKLNKIWRKLWHTFWFEFRCLKRLVTWTRKKLSISLLRMLTTI